MLGIERPHLPAQGPHASEVSGQRRKRILIFGLFFLLAVAALTYIGDYAVIRYRIARQSNPYGTVMVRPYYAIHMKNGNTEFDFQDPQSQSCLNSLFPHFGITPCWYLNRHAEKRTDI